jgi:RNA-directed DNA polymerase
VKGFLDQIQESLKDKRYRPDAVLGYTFRYDRDLHGRDFRYLNGTPSHKALKAEKQALREKISHKQSHVPIPRLIRKINRHLQGWSRYFSFGYSRKVKRAVNQ